MKVITELLVEFLVVVFILIDLHHELNTLLHQVLPDHLNRAGGLEGWGFNTLLHQILPDHL